MSTSHSNSWFKQRCCCKWEDVSCVYRTITEANSKDVWIFRGHGDSAWQLQTSLERFCQRMLVDPKDRSKAEWVIDREFRRRYHHFNSDVPTSSDLLEWWSIMQHHGAPTRLQDWTYSFYVTAYFALQDKLQDKESKPAAIWAFNATKERDALRQILPKKDHKWLKTNTSRNEKKGWKKWFKEFMMSERTLVHSASPFRINERLTIQRGTFLVCGNLNRSFEENLQSLKLHTSDIVKILLQFDETERLNALRRLDEMNINRATLFPGLDGFAQCLNTFHWRVARIKDGLLSD